MSVGKAGVVFQGETAITVDDKGRLAVPTAYRDLVLPMVLAIEALMARGLAPAEIAGSGGEASSMAAMAHEARRGMRDLPTG